MVEGENRKKKLKLNTRKTHSTPVATTQEGEGKKKGMEKGEKKNLFMFTTDLNDEKPRAVL